MMRATRVCVDRISVLCRTGDGNRVTLRHRVPVSGLTEEIPGVGSVLKRSRSEETLAECKFLALRRVLFIK